MLGSGPDWLRNRNQNTKNMAFFLPTSQSFESVNLSKPKRFLLFKRVSDLSGGLLLSELYGIVLTCPYNINCYITSLQEIISRNNAPAWKITPDKSQHNDARPILFQLKSSLPFSLFLFVTREYHQYHHYCRGSPLFKSRRQKLCSKWRDNTDAFIA